MNIRQETLELLKEQKNLLAFSGGTDSSVLFDILVKNNIPFDLAIVNYNTRNTSNDEMNYAIELSKIYNKTCHIESVKLQNTSNFEKEARDIRHKFFEKTINNFKYDNLITAHNLNDKLEWFLMQMTKGAGTKELFGMEEKTAKNSFFIIRPLIHTEKSKILNYIENNNIKCFYDQSNNDPKYTRNYFRINYVNELVKNFGNGISRTFDILEDELQNNELLNIKLNFEKIDNLKNEYVIECNDKNYMYVLDKFFKEHYETLLSYEEKTIFKNKNEISHNLNNLSLVCSKYHNKIYIFNLENYVNNDLIMDKKFKEKMRISKVPQKLRYFLLKNKIELF